MRGPLAHARAAMADLPVGGGISDPAKADIAIQRGVDLIVSNVAVRESLGLSSPEALFQLDPGLFADAVATALLLAHAGAQAGESRDFNQAMIDRNVERDIAYGLTGGQFGQGTPKPKADWRPDLHVTDMDEQDESRRRISGRKVAASVAAGVSRAQAIEREKTRLFDRAKAAETEQLRRLGRA